MMYSKIIGQGAFSKVHLGSNSLKAEDVAIKVVDRTKLGRDEQERLKAEVVILREIPTHKNILGVYSSIII